MSRSGAALTRLAIALVLLSAPVLATAQQATSDADARAAAVRKLMEATGAGRLGLQVIDAIMVPMKKAHPEVPESFWAEYRAEIHADEMVELVVPIYAKYLTVEDMRQLAAFYETPLGQKMVKVQPAILQECMAAGQQWGQDVARRIIQRLKEKGYGGKAATD